MSSWITICETCKCEGWDAETAKVTDGEVLADKVEAYAAAEGINTRRVSCTMGCERACNIIVQGAGKIGYSLGKFVPSDEKAQAIVEYAAMHAASETGQVPFREWPAGIKGHFVSRHLPVPETE